MDRSCTAPICAYFKLPKQVYSVAFAVIQQYFLLLSSARLFWYETPFNLACGTEFRDDSLRFLLHQELVEILELMICTNKVGPIVTPYE